jgi:flagellar assembly factor FliW
MNELFFEPESKVMLMNILKIKKIGENLKINLQFPTEFLNLKSDKF